MRTATFCPSVTVTLTDDGKPYGVRVDFSDSFQHGDHDGTEDHKVWSDDKHQAIYTDAMDNAISEHNLTTIIAGNILRLIQT